MEEDTESPLTITKIFKSCLLPLTMFAALVACTAGPSAEAPLLTSASLEVSNGDLVSFDETAVHQNQDMVHASFMGVEFSYTDEIFGLLKETSVESAKAADPEEALPERIEFIFSRERGDYSSELIVLPIDQYGAISNNAKSQITQLRSILDGRSYRPEKPLPILPMTNAVEKSRSAPNFVGFQNGNGISFFVLVDHDHNLMTDDLLFFIFQGLTDDAQFYVALFIPLAQVSTPKTIVEDQDVLSMAANQIGLEALEEQWHLSDLIESVESLKVFPDKRFPTPVPAVYSSFPGVLAGYDPEIFKGVSYQKSPAIVSSPDGTAVYLSGIPDIIGLTFEPIQTKNGSSELTIQPIRDDQGNFYSSIPSWQQQSVRDLELSASKVYQDQLSLNLSFVNGSGKRYLTTSAKNASSFEPAESAYQFDGVTDDGRFFIQFSHVFDVPDSLREGEMIIDSEAPADLLATIAQLDEIIQSLAISFDASTDSSIPENSSDCTNVGEFLEDITIPDNTKIERGATFKKTWQVRNSGTCTWTPEYQIIQAGGNPLTWRVSDLPGVVIPGEETQISVTIHAPFTPGKYHAWWQLADTIGTPFGSFFSVLFEAPKPPTDIPGYGVVQGNITYPAGGTPALIIYFLRTDESERYALQTKEGWTHYANEIPVGEYYVFARVLGDGSDSGGGYTEAVECGFTCEDHALRVVVVEEGKATADTNIQDWYAPAGTFPLP